MKLTGTTTYRTGAQPGDARVLGAVRPERERSAATASASNANPCHAISPVTNVLGTTGVFVAMWQSTKCTTRLLGAAT